MLATLLAPASAAFVNRIASAGADTRGRGAVHMNLAEGTLNVGVISAGRIGIVHLEALASCAEAKPIIISNPTVSKAEAAASQYPGMQFSGDAMDVINHPDVEAVWICSPSQFHAEQIMACADAGKHIFCEKPIATDLVSTIEAVNYCRKKNVKLMTALQRRFDPNFGRIKQAVDSGEIGEPIIVKLCSRDPAPPPKEYVKGGGGIFKDMAVHDLDMARFLMGCEPIAVLATGSSQVSDIGDLEGPEAFDAASCIVRFENGKDAIIDVCRKATYGYDQRAEVLGQDGMVMSENLQPSNVRKFTGEFVGQADMPYDFFMSRYKEAYVAETEAFVESLCDGLPAPCTGRDGLIALVMAMAAGKSAMEERWVEFGEIIREENEKAGKFGDYGSLLDKDGKLGANWVRGALLSVDRDPNSMVDLQEIFKLLDTKGDGTLPANAVEELVEGLHLEKTVDAKEIYTTAAQVTAKEITFEQFIEAWEKEGFSMKDSDSLKGSYNFLGGATVSK